MPPQVLADFLHPITWVRSNDDNDDDSRWLLPGKVSLSSFEQKATYLGELGALIDEYRTPKVRES